MIHSITLIHLHPLLAQSAGPGGYRPFLDPIPIHDEWWLTLIPLAFLVSVAYKAVRVKTFHHYWRQVLMMTVQIVVAMIVLAIAIYLFVELLVPILDSP